MEKKWIVIRLLSDMCVSDGGVYNSALDTDICHDDLGFPYIPAKRLKGCLRECALELKDWGDDISPEELFGDKGDGKINAGKVRIGNAQLQNYEEYRKAVLKHKNHIVFHPQNVLSHYSYVRTQTAIDSETGVADDTSLRTMRVASRGLIFKAECEVPKELSDKLSRCCTSLTQMGIARTRGLGEVIVTLEQDIPDVDDRIGTLAMPEKKDEGTFWRANYTIELEEAVICKSVNGEEANTLDYFEGSKILGLLAQKMGQEAFLSFINEGRLFCSNAYIAECADGKRVRMEEVPAFIYSIKDNKSEYINKIYDNKDTAKTLEYADMQLNQMKHSYVYQSVDGKLYRREVETEERYHHRRDDDKSVGRASSKQGQSEDADFYQISSICAGQKFVGYIVGTWEQIKKITDTFAQTESAYLGYSRNSEYGRVRIIMEKPAVIRNENTIEGKYLLVRLLSPAIIYNKHASYSTNPQDLLDEIRIVLGIRPEIDVTSEKIRKFLNYRTIGGFNVTWGDRKPILQAFDKGTAILIELPENTVLSCPEILVIGERNNEGYGEIAVSMVDLKQTELVKGTVITGSRSNIDELDVSGNPLAIELAGDLLKEFVQYRASSASIRDIRRSERDDKLSTVSNMIQMCRECSCLSEVENSVQKRYEKASAEKQEKKKHALAILKAVRDGCKTILQEFASAYHLTNYSADSSKTEMRYLEAYLVQAKYTMRDDTRQKDPA